MKGKGGEGSVYLLKLFTVAAPAVSGQASMKPDSSLEMPWVLVGTYNTDVTETVPVPPARQRQRGVSDCRPPLCDGCRLTEESERLTMEANPGCVLRSEWVTTI